MAAFQQLGPFISTFADPQTTGLFVNEDGCLFFKHPDGTEGYVDKLHILEHGYIFFKLP